MEDQFERLKSELGDKFDLVTETVWIGNFRADIVRPRDPEAFLDSDTLASPHGELAWQPYWAQAWDSAMGVASFLSEMEIAGKDVLDLGCGLGITGAAALSRGARVVLGDNAPPALAFATMNTWQWRERAQILFVDWNKTRLDQSFDVIVGSDILYDRNEIDPLDQFWRDHLKRDGCVLLGDPTRPMTNEFLNRLEELGWQLKTGSRKCAGIDREIRIVEMRLR